MTLPLLLLNEQVTIGSNPCLHNRLLALELKSPWNYLHELHTQNRAGSAVGNETSECLVLVDLVSNRWNDLLRELAEWNQLKIAYEARLVAH